MVESYAVSSGWGRAWPAPAKLNLMLRIVGRRPDGYHLLQTVFQFVELCDWITFNSRPDGVVKLKTPLPGVPENQDLTVRAAKLLKDATGFRGGVEIDVDKRLPMGGGIGGGSSDAATTLVVLNALWGLGLGEEELLPLGLQLGADLPVFVYGRSAWAEGVGENLTPLDLPEPWYVVVVPDCHVSTQKVFAAEDLTRNSEAITIGDFLSGQRGNDCLSVVRKMYGDVNIALDDLSAFGEARLTGTGACVFAAFDSLAEARGVAGSLERRWRVFVTKGVNHSPLYRELLRATS
ncbi:MAG: 4-(cytidine 5'-diphospho)-2-C-methyl-D-erythritol kinase [Pseudomonadota bacterium]